MENKDVREMIAKSPRRSPVPWVVLGMLTMPFVVLVWLLATSVTANLAGYQHLRQTIKIFHSGESLLRPLEEMAVYSPSYILINDPVINPSFVSARERVSPRLLDFTNMLARQGGPIADDYVSALHNDWISLDITTGRSVTMDPFDEVSRIVESVYRVLGSLLYFLELDAGQRLHIFELLMLNVEDMRLLRKEVSALHALSVYISRRGGYIGSGDAQRLEQAWSDLEGASSALAGRLSGVVERGVVSATGTRIFEAQEQIQQYLEFIEGQFLLADVVSMTWSDADAEGRLAWEAMQLLSAELLFLAGDSVEQSRRSQITRDILLSAGLLVLYALVVGIVFLFFGSRERMLQAMTESRTKSQFLARMSHEIRTPLNGVIGLAELLRETSPDKRQREYIGLIDSAGRSLMSLVNDILDYAKIEAGKLEVDSIPFNLRDLVNETCQMFSLQVHDNQSLMACLVSDNVPVEVSGDPTRLRQVLINLIGNAVKFTKDGWVELRVSSRESIGGRVLLRFEIQDSGIGLSQDEKKQLFGMFSQASADVARRYGGTGLGLSISRQLVQLMGGNIDVISATNMGSTFWFDLLMPVESPALPIVHKSLDSPVLLLDQTSLLERMVAAAGACLASVETLSSTRKALGALRGTPRFSLLVLHCRVDQGAEDKALLEQLVQLAISCKVPVRLLTGIRGEVGNRSLLPKNELISVITRSVFNMDQLIALFQCGDAMSEEVGPNEPSLPLPQFAGIRVLVAEDNPVNQLVTCGYLRKLEIEPELAENGREAVKHYRESKGAFDLVLMDLDMPVLDGPSATRQIRALEHANNWPQRHIIALSAHVLPEYSKEVRESGMDGQLVKPVTVRQLSDMISGVLHC